MKKNHPASWYIVAGVATLSLAIWGFLTGIYALSIAVVILAGVYVMMENNAPESVEAAVSDTGIGIGDTFASYGEIESFSIVFEGNVPRYLRITLKKKTLKLLDIPLNHDVNVAELRAYLLGYLPEAEKSELGFTDRITDRLSL